MIHVMAEKESPTPHVVVLPFPAHGHINPMLTLSKLFSHFGLETTFAISHRFHTRLNKLTHLNKLTRLPSFHFATITDGAPSDLPKAPFQAFPLFITPTARAAVATELRDLLAGLSPPATCVVADGLMSTIALDVTAEFGIPVIAFRTYSATCTWATVFLKKMVEEGVIPVQIQEDMEKEITSIPGLENLLRGQDLPVICRLDPDHPVLNFYITETSAMCKASSIIFNTFHNLESPIISKFSTIFPKVYSLGPLHSLFKPHITTSNNNDTTCITWLNSHHPNTVLYVSFGTVVCLSRDQVMEFWHGLVNSGKPFLWVLRDDSIQSGDGVVDSVLRHGVPAERGLLVDWAPQEEVLAHPAVGGFLSHSGWNSTLESISEGVPLICWPLIADQTVNSRCVSEMWRVGIDMKGSCDRVIVENMVRDLMENKREDILRSTAEMANMANESVKKGGSSYRDLEKLIEDIRSMSLNN
ncbi:7-deoxyloganetic acid glucosyltransferase [Senna tora]|uniref:Glycosyltransferase n=1 Tax=Senna tora TaxID=362788 RepID=A0A835CND6_9FABA|nr:7-deoxyloganetic acid glucosyltransferase [Senna tora]